MKPISYFILFLLVLTSCIKDDTVTNTNSFLEDVTNTRDGDYSPFLSTITMVRKDVFTGTLYIYNINKIDSVVVNRISKSSHKYESFIFNPYKVYIKFLDGSIENFEALCQESLGSYKVIKPDVSYNQLDQNNKNNYVIISRIGKTFLEYNPYCGKAIYKWMYKIKDNSGSYLVPITSLCNNTLPYIQLFK